MKKFFQTIAQNRNSFYFPNAIIIGGRLYDYVSGYKKWADFSLLDNVFLIIVVNLLLVLLIYSRELYRCRVKKEKISTAES
jgi:hypothetical protein